MVMVVIGEEYAIATSVGTARRAEIGMRPERRTVERARVSSVRESVRER
jgi:hypothetical protein